MILSRKGIFYIEDIIFRFTFNKEIVRKLIAISGREVAVCYQNKRRKNEIMNVVADIEMAKEKLGWEPRVDIDEGLKMVFGSCNTEYRKLKLSGK